MTVQRQRGAELRHHLVSSQSVALIKSGQAPDLILNKYWAKELGSWSTGWDGILFRSRGHAHNSPRLEVYNDSLAVASASIGQVN